MADIARLLQYHGHLPAKTAAVVAEYLDDVVKVDLDNTPDPAPGAREILIGFQLTNVNGNVPSQICLDLGVFNDVTLSDPATLASFVIADPEDAKGTIVAVAGSTAKVLSDSTGRFVCKLSALSAGAFFIASSPCPGSPPLDTREVDWVVFS